MTEVAFCSGPVGFETLRLRQSFFGVADCWLKERKLDLGAFGGQGQSRLGRNAVILTKSQIGRADRQLYK